MQYSYLNGVLTLRMNSANRDALVKQHPEGVEGRWFPYDNGHFSSFGLRPAVYGSLVISDLENPGQFILHFNKALVDCPDGKFPASANPDIDEIGKHFNVVLSGVKPEKPAPKPAPKKRKPRKKKAQA